MNSFDMGQNQNDMGQNQNEQFLASWILEAASIAPGYITLISASVITLPFSVIS